MAHNHLETLAPGGSGDSDRHMYKYRYNKNKIESKENNEPGLKACATYVTCFLLVIAGTTRIT